MSEYWKSTPKYWCKHCKTYVRDTKLEKQNHEATAKHQGNLKRFLRDLHRGNERDEREKQRAKDEVDRLNGVVSKSGSSLGSGSTDPPWKRKSAGPPSSASMQATPDDRKRQLAQLAEMGVAIPDEFRREMAMAGDWQTLSETPIFDNVKKEEDTKDSKADTLNVGVRKRKLEGEDDEEEAGEPTVRRAWGSTTQTYSGPTAEDEDLDALLSSTTARLHKDRNLDTRLEKQSIDGFEDPALGGNSDVNGQPDDGSVPIKTEDSLDDGAPADTPAASTLNNREIKQEATPSGGEIVFKKRKAKTMRQS